jgi:hypothetical protein
MDSLFDVVAIPPLSISVAVEGASSIDDCCTARGMTPLQLDNGSIYWQVCYFCTNAVETIIFPQAIVDSSDVLSIVASDRLSVWCIYSGLHTI